MSVLQLMRRESSELRLAASIAARFGLMDNARILEAKATVVDGMIAQQSTPANEWVVERVAGLTPAADVIQTEADRITVAAAVAGKNGMFESGARLRAKADGMRRAVEILKTIQASHELSGKAGA